MAYSNDFTLLKKLNYNDSNIETFFVERAEQLLKKDGYAAIVLPQSILSNSKYENMRRFILENFVIKGMLMTSDITFSGTTTSPVVLFLKKEKRYNKHYKICLIGSPKYLEPTSSKMKNKEVQFLGYEFSTNRAKTGITILKDSTLKHLSSIMQEFIKNNNEIIEEKYTHNVSFKYLDDILLNKEESYVGDIYPKYVKVNGVPLSHYCNINSRIENEFIKVPTNYVEIGDLPNLPNTTKKKKTTRYCKKGDILISSLTPKKTHIVISDGDYMVSMAIHVLSGFKNDTIRDFVFKELRSQNVLHQMNTMLDGFKITYAKISEANLYNNVLINNK